MLILNQNYEVKKLLFNEDMVQNIHVGYNATEKTEELI
jgi:hypothetical protein